MNRHAWLFAAAVASVTAGCVDADARCIEIELTYAGTAEGAV